MWERIHLNGIYTALAEVGLILPDIAAAPTHSAASLNKPLRLVLSDGPRSHSDGPRSHSRALLSVFETSLRMTTVPKYMLPNRLLGHLCRSQHYQVYPANHMSAADRYTVLVWNIRKKQDRWRCLVVDLDILEI
ncbi:hypothetical protein PHMEG_00034452 [Phytophthora megakarya]|uniref:Uncharacterized protein n=1 Tax=Phytophthora megakarya TaxID=4795 RepID=A0A225UQZ9_9STRA|nr:hypothetical protein PHMEG_00034452 [Phytophthora megakarya]